MRNQRLATIATCTLLLVSSWALGARSAPQSGYLQYHNVDASVELAKKLLQANDVSDTASRMPLMVLYSHDVAEPTYGPCLKCALEKFKANLMPNTPADIFLFTRQQHISSLLRLSWFRAIPNMFIIPLDENDERSWSMPKWLRPANGGQNVRGWSAGFTNEYRLMGQWRLAFSFPFARALGYKYLLQIDSDTHVNGKIPYNLVTFMQERQLFMTNRDSFFYEVRDYGIGLPELAKFWLVTRVNPLDRDQNVTVETAAASGIKGPILKHCNPQTLAGLRTQNRENSRQTGWEGWDSMCIAGNFNIFSLDFWFQDDVQDFVQLVLRTGAHLEHRWVDVATESMIWQLFCPEEKFHVFKDLSIDHGHFSGFCTACGSDWLSPSYITRFTRLL